ncbi:hypothetical protein, partial [Dietzia papillomatosis]|uniref:hypothetical protein n=1 Tax=Dietzia papillomatosis TaxID=282305 RepID=UPI001E5B0B8B
LNDLAIRGSSKVLDGEVAVRMPTDRVRRNAGIWTRDQAGNVGEATSLGEQYIHLFADVFVPTDGATGLDYSWVVHVVSSPTAQSTHLAALIRP